MVKCLRNGFSDLIFNIPNTTNTYVFVLFTGFEGKSPEFQEPWDLRSNPFQGEGMMQSYPRKGIGQKTPRRLGQRCKRMPQDSHEPQGRFCIHWLSMSTLIFVHIRLRFHYFWALYLGLHNIGKVPQKCRIFQPLYFSAPRLVFCIRDNLVISHALSEYLMCVVGNKFN